MWTLKKLFGLGSTLSSNAFMDVLYSQELCLEAPGPKEARILIHQMSGNKSVTVAYSQTLLWPYKVRPIR